MFPHLPSHVPPMLRSPRTLAAVALTLTAVAGVTSYLLTRRKPTAEEVERARRDLLAATGRITDGTITETQWLPDEALPATPEPVSQSDPANPLISLFNTTSDPVPDATDPNPGPLISTFDAPTANPASETPVILVYRYVIAGVTYECAQDVKLLAQFVRHVRVDLPIQVRFDPRNPANSIVVAEAWNGLRLDPTTPAAEHPGPATLKAIQPGPVAPREQEKGLSS